MYLGSFFRIMIFRALIMDRRPTPRSIRFHHICAVCQYLTNTNYTIQVITKLTNWEFKSIIKDIYVNQIASNFTTTWLKPENAISKTSQSQTKKNLNTRIIMEKLARYTGLTKVLKSSQLEDSNLFWTLVV